MAKGYNTFSDVGYNKVADDGSHQSWTRKLSFSMVMFPLQVLMIGLFTGFTTYRSPVLHPGGNYVTDHYPIFQNVHVMVCVGLGLLLCYLKKHGYSSISYNFMLMSIVAQWSTFMNSWVRHGMTKDFNKGKIEIGIEELIEGDVTAAVILISWCVVIGKTSRLQLVIIAILEPVFYAVSKTIILDVLHITDAGGSVTIHMFAAYYGMAVSFVIRNHGVKPNGDDHDNQSTSYSSDLFCMIGTLFLWVYWPSFNGVDLGGKQLQQMRAVVNTYFSLTACVVTMMAVSPLLRGNNKIEMEFVQNASLAGGVAAGATANLLISPGAAVFVGAVSGIISTLGFCYLTDLLKNRLNIHDTAGTHNLHAIPGILAGIASSIVVASVEPESYPSLEEYRDIFPMVKTSNNTQGTRSASTQALYQLSMIPIAFAIAVVGGLITGFVIKNMHHPDEDQLYDDNAEFNVPSEDKDENPSQEAEKLEEEAQGTTQL